LRFDSGQISSFGCRILYYDYSARGRISGYDMPSANLDNDDAFLQFLEDGNYVDALEAERLRTEFRRRRSNDKKLTMAALIVHKGHFTRDQADDLVAAFESGGAVNQTLADPAPWAGAPSQDQDAVFQEIEDDSDIAGENTLAPDPEPEPDNSREPPQERRTGPVDDSQPSEERRPTSPVVDPAGRKRPTDAPTRPVKRAQPQSESKRVTDKRTSSVEDSQADTGRRTTARTRTKGTGGWSIHDDTDSLSATDKIVPAGTIIAGGQMTIAQVREQVGISGDVKLISSKMDSTVAHLQPDATAERKRYVVVREIARGGMGKVLEVEDTELRRSVALKVLRKEYLARKDIVERFLEEAQITGQLEHPNIVPVHEMGVDGAGNLYFTMKYVEGMSLSELLLKLRQGNRDTERDFPLLKLLDIFIKICEGIGFAHNRGVIHRDLKPANIMVGKFGEVQVMDWGVAKIIGREMPSEGDSGIVMTDRLDQGSAHTMMGSVIGTPSFMAPEQARGDLDAIGPKTDIFSLGVILYEMLALRSPWTGKSSDEVLEQVRETTPVKPSERNPDRVIPAELERLCLRCLEKDPEARVSSTKELEDNVRSFIEGRAMGAVDYSAIRLATKWIARHKREVGGAALTLVLVVGGVLGTLWYLKKLDQERILGLNDDAVAILADWEELAEELEFDNAEQRVDEAKDLFQRVLAVNPDDERALAGLEDIRDINSELRARRVSHEREEARAAEIDRLLAEARDYIQRATDVVHTVERLTQAYGRTEAVLGIAPDNRDALELKVEVCKRLVDFSIARGDHGVARFWLAQWRTTGLAEEERRRRLARLQG
jgi:tRNA A-37 threonylcarbamoyl transferase component Bud32